MSSSKKSTPNPCSIPLTTFALRTDITMPRSVDCSTNHFSYVEVADALPLSTVSQWNKADTSENFFQVGFPHQLAKRTASLLSHATGSHHNKKWLDNGGGKDLDLKECPRERLESEKITFVFGLSGCSTRPARLKTSALTRIRFLNADQRKNYLVLIDDKGRLRWNKTGKLVDTSPGRHKDLGNGEGIVEMGEEERDVSKRTCAYSPLSRFRTKLRIHKRRYRVSPQYRRNAD